MSDQVKTILIKVAAVIGALIWIGFLSWLTCLYFIGIIKIVMAISILAGE